MFTHKLYLIENKTPLHVGSGDTNFDLVDRQVQRDTLTSYPTIHASSLKGALKEYCKFRHDTQESEKFLSHVFGNEDNAGKMRFTQAHLLSVPMRSNIEPYYHTTSPKALQELLDTVDVFSLSIEDKAALKKFASYTGKEILVATKEAVIEDFTVKHSNDFDFEALQRLIGAPAAIVPNETFTQLLKDLPVIARNQLENGESKNLWYEEVLPRKSKLYTLISAPTYLNKNDETKLKNTFERLHNYICDANTIHIGANASIGYGVTTFKELSHA